MTIEEARARKERMVSSITALLKEFEAATSMHVTSIAIERVHWTTYMQKHSSISEVHVETQLP